jgi:hypothetical protein
MTTETISTVAATVETAVAANPEIKLESNKAIRQHMAGVAADFLTVCAEAMASAVAGNPDLDIDKASRRAKLGAVGMAAETHARCNGLLAGMTDKEMKVFKQLGVDAARLALDPKAGGFSREHKLQLATIVACVAQNKRPDAIDLTAANKALLELDPGASTKRAGHNTISHLIDTLQSKERFTAGYWAAECNGPTQAGYIIGLLVKLGMSTERGTKESRECLIKADHPVVIALKAIA